MDNVLLITIIVLGTIIGFSCIGFAFGRFIQINKERIDNEPLRQEKQKLEAEIDVLDFQEQQIRNNIRNAENEYEKKKRLLDEAVENFSQKLEFEKEKAQESAQEEINQINLEIQEVLAAKRQTEDELSSLRATRNAAIEAARKEQEMQAKPEDFCIPFSAQELHDIKILNNIRIELNYPIALGKVIWSVFIQKKMNTFCAAKLGTAEKVTGIYKITNIKTNECYVGQSVNIKDRFADHIKAGVGATESSATNKLYQAMQQYGIQNFAFELLEACPSSELNAKEKFFISLYQSDIVGYNQNKGVNK